jgi:diguanylate cyclase (GGDEF)-like protein
MTLKAMNRPLRVLLFATGLVERAQWRAALGGFDVEEIGDESLLSRDRTAVGDVLVVVGTKLPHGCLESDRRPAIVWIAPTDADGPVDALLPANVTEVELRECVELVGTRAALVREIEGVAARVQSAFDRHQWRGGSSWRSPRELLQLAMHDPLTGVFNRRYLHENLSAEFQRARGSGQSLGAVILDLDRFKPINDMCGHRVGDLVLCEVAARLQQTTRGSDRVCRYGGDEFAVIAPGSDLQSAGLLAERLRVAISEMPVVADGHEIRLTCSFGAASTPENGPKSADDLMHSADLAMLAAKRTGGNAVQVTQARRASEGG